MSAARRPLIVFLFLTSLAVAFWSFQFLRPTQAESNVATLPPMSLTVIGADGTQVVLNETDIAELSSYRGYGGFKTSFPAVKGLGNYTGVRLDTLCGLVGGLTNAGNVTIRAADYEINLTYAQVNGEFVTYDTSGEEVPHSLPLVPIVAYYFNDENISDGPLRLAIVGSEGLVTDSVYWVKWVVEIEVFDNTVSEFPSSTVLLVLIMATLASVVSLKVLHQRQDRLRRFERPAKRYDVE
jgi:hypothetical protein